MDTFAFPNSIKGLPTSANLFVLYFPLPSGTCCSPARLALGLLHQGPSWGSGPPINFVVASSGRVPWGSGSAVLGEAVLPE